MRSTILRATDPNGFPGVRAGDGRSTASANRSLVVDSAVSSRPRAQRITTIGFRWTVRAATAAATIRSAQRSPIALEQRHAARRFGKMRASYTCIYDVTA